MWKKIAALLALMLVALALMLVARPAHAVLWVTTDANGNMVAIWVPVNRVYPIPEELGWEGDWLTTDPNPVLECDDNRLDLVWVNQTLVSGHKRADLALVRESPLPNGLTTECRVRVGSTVHLELELEVTNTVSQTTVH